MRALKALKSFNPNGVMLDDGRQFDLTGLTGPNLQQVGAEQGRLRDEAARAAAWNSGNPNAVMEQSRAEMLRPKEFGDFFGLLQAKENAAAAAGKDMNVDLVGRRGMGGIGFLKAMDDGGTSYSPSDFEPVLGVEGGPRATRPFSRGVAALAGADPAPQQSSEPEPQQPMPTGLAAVAANAARIRAEQAAAAQAADAAAAATGAAPGAATGPTMFSKQGAGASVTGAVNAAEGAAAAKAAKGTRGKGKARTQTDELPNSGLSPSRFGKDNYSYTSVGQ